MFADRRIELDDNLLAEEVAYAWIDLRDRSLSYTRCRSLARVRAAIMARHDDQSVEGHGLTREPRRVARFGQRRGEVIGFSVIALQSGS